MCLIPGGAWQILQALDGSVAAFSSGVPGPGLWLEGATCGLTGLGLVVEWQSVQSTLTLALIPAVFSFSGLCTSWHVTQEPASLSETPVKSTFAACANLLAYAELVVPSRFIVPGVHSVGAPGAYGVMLLPYPLIAYGGHPTWAPCPRELGVRAVQELRSVGMVREPVRLLLFIRKGRRRVAIGCVAVRVLVCPRGRVAFHSVAGYANGDDVAAFGRVCRPGCVAAVGCDVAPRALNAPLVPGRNVGGHRSRRGGVDKQGAAANSRQGFEVGAGEITMRVFAADGISREIGRPARGMTRTRNASQLRRVAARGRRNTARTACKASQPITLPSRCDSRFSHAPLDTAPEEMEPTRGERIKAWQFESTPFVPSSCPLSGTYRGALLRIY
jgi:hypothetical protein